MNVAQQRSSSNAAKTKRRALLAVAIIVAAWLGPVRADSPVTLRVLELGGAERWRAIGSVISTVTDAHVVILQEESSLRSRFVRPGDAPWPGIEVLSVSAHDVGLRLHGAPARLLITAGAASTPDNLVAPVPTAPEPENRPAPAGIERVRLTLTEFRDAVTTVRRALVSGDIALGENEDGVFGVKIVGVPPGGLTARLGLRTGDVIVAVNGRPAADQAAAAALIDSAAPDQSVLFAYRRGREIGQGEVAIVSDGEQ